MINEKVRAVASPRPFYASMRWFSFASHLHHCRPLVLWIVQYRVQASMFMLKYIIKKWKHSTGSDESTTGQQMSESVCQARFELSCL